MTTRQYVIAYTLAFVVLAVGVLAWYFGRGTVTDFVSSWPGFESASSTALTLSPEEANSPLLRTAPGVERRYVNDVLGFSFTLPDGYLTSEQPTAARDQQAVIVVSKGGHGFLVLAQPLGTGSGTLTADDIQRNSPNETITNIQRVAVRGGITGFEFQTNSQLWKGNGVGLWFTHDGYLYEVGARVADLPLLDFARITWGFR